MSRFSTLVVAFVLSLTPTLAHACPFCTAEQSTLTEELANSDAAVIARLITPAPPLEETPDDPLDPEAGKAEFEVAHTLFGPDGVTDGAAIKALYFGEPDKDSLYMIRGVGQPLDWAIPLKLTDQAVEYVKLLRTLPESGPGRVAFFKDYLQHEDPMLAQDAYDEFARAPYDDLKGIADQLDRHQLLDWIEDPAVSPSRRRLFFTMLGVCGVDEDLPRLEALLLSDSRLMIPLAEALSAAAIGAGGPLAQGLVPEATELEERRRKLGLDAMIACYLTLRGPEGLDLIDRRFLEPVEVAGKLPDYSHIYAALMALRFLAEETELIPMPRILASARLLLDNPDFADQVIPDLARWEDWTVLERLTEMYRRAGEPDSGVQKYVREPIITYLDVAAEQSGEVSERATQALASIEDIDPDAVRRSRSLRSFGFLGRAQTASLPTGSDPPRLSEDPPSPAGMSMADEEPVLVADNVASDEPPDPAAFAPGDADEGSPQSDGVEAPAEDAVQTPPAEQTAASPTSPAPPTQADPPPVAELAEVPPPAPSRALLIAAPLTGAVLCFGLFWVILRPGGA